MSECFMLIASAKTRLDKEATLAGPIKDFLHHTTTGD